MPAERHQVCRNDPISMEESARQSKQAGEPERLFADISATVAEGLLVLDQNQTIQMAGPSIARTLQTTVDEMQGCMLSEICGGQLFNISLRESLAKLKINGDHFSRVAVRLVDSNLGRKSFLVNGRLSIDDAGEHRVIVAYRETTSELRLLDHKRRTQEHYQNLLQQVADYAIFMIDVDGRATSWNEGVEKVLGFAEDEFVGQDIVPLIFTTEAQEAGVAKWELETAASEGSASDDRWMVRKNGEQFWASGITTGLHDEDGTLIGFNKVMRDLTSRKKAEDQLRLLAAELSEADARKNEFLATLAHELRNPLSPIKTAAQLMQVADDDTSDFRELSGVIDRQVKQMVRLIDDLLDVSRISRGKITIRKETCDLQQVVENAMEAASPFIKNSGQDIDIDVTDEALIVVGDSARLSQVLVNVLNNAAKYTPAAGKIWLVVKREGAEAIISVRDNGVGILDSQLVTIFEMFQQVDRSKERGQSGLGIGLSLVKNLVQLHDGTVIARSEGKNKGSTFEIRLPLTSGSVRVEKQGTSSNREVPTSRSFKVLVVEDTTAIRTVLVKLLQRMGHQVDQACDGREGFEKAIQNTPEVILSDISMPNMNGHELAQKIRATPSLVDVQMVALTGFGQDADKENAILSGFSDHMVKPADMRILAEYFAKLELMFGE